MPEHDVATYYDRSSRAFLRFGHGRRQLAIHRAVWGPGTNNRADAIHFVHTLILRQMHAAHATRIVDLGCGVGGSIRYLARSHQAEYLGLTISQAQTSYAERVLADTSRASVLNADMRDVARHISDTRGISLFYAIESLVHVSSQEDVFTGLSHILKSGDRLVVCDDVLTTESPRSGAARRFIDGWHATGLSSVTAITARARSAGMDCILDYDLTPYLELNRPRDIAIRAAAPFMRPLAAAHPWVSSLVGGDALQTCLNTREITYRFLVFRRR